MFDNDCDERQINIFCSIRQQFPSPSPPPPLSFCIHPTRWKCTNAHQKVIFPIDQTKKNFSVAFFSFVWFFVTFANFRNRRWKYHKLACVNEIASGVDRGSGSLNRKISIFNENISPKSSVYSIYLYMLDITTLTNKFASGLGLKYL